MASKCRTSDTRCGGAVNLALSPGTPAGHVRRRGMPAIGRIPSPPLHPCPSGVGSECPPFAGSRREPPCVENSRPSPPPLAQSTAKLLRRVRAPDGLAPVQHIHSRQAQRRNRTEQHQRHAMSHQVQNHELPASSPDIVDHLDKLLIVQVVHQAHAHGHVDSPNGTRRSWKVLRVYSAVLRPLLVSTSRMMRRFVTWTIPSCFKRWASAPPISSVGTILAAEHGPGGYTNREGGSV